MSISLGLADDSDPPPREGAGFWIRALARLIDLIVHFAVGFVAAMVAAILVGISAALQDSSPDAALAALTATSPLGFLAGLIGDLALHTVAEGLHGSTLGKRICGLTVISEDDKPATLAGALKRSVRYFLDSLFFGYVGARRMSESPSRQRHGDVWAKTLVVRISSLEPRARRSWLRFLLANAAALALDFVILFIELGTKLL